MTKGPSTGALGPSATRRVNQQRPRRRGNIRYSAEIAEAICERIARGEVWFQIAGSPGLPEYTTVYKWVNTRPDFAEAWAQAKAMAADLRADKVLVVAEEGTEDLQRDRMHIGALKWHVARAENPKREPGTWDLGKDRKLVIEVRKFERAYRADGTVYVREVGSDDDGEVGLEDEREDGA